MPRGLSAPHWGRISFERQGGRLTLYPTGLHRQMADGRCLTRATLLARKRDNAHLHKSSILYLRCSALRPSPLSSLVIGKFCYLCTYLERSLSRCYATTNMEGEISERDIVRNSTPESDIPRHPLTILQAVELFADFGVPRSKRSVQRFCKQGYLDSVQIKGSRGDQFFINRELVERYAEELRQIEAVAALGDEQRHNAPQRAIARNSAPERGTMPGAGVEPSHAADAPEEHQSAAIVQQLRDENLNLRIDNRGKEQAISFITAQVREKDQHLQDMSYRLGVAETRVAQLEAPRAHDEVPRQRATEPATEIAEAIVMPVVQDLEAPLVAEPPPHAAEPKRSLFGRLLG